MQPRPIREKWVNIPPKELTESYTNYKHLKIHSPSMNRETGCSVFLPQCYDDCPDRHFPVIYMLHGGYGNETTCPIVTYKTFLSKMNELDRPTIAVYPNGGALSDFCDCKATTGRGETSVIKEVLPYIDAHFRTINDRRSRAVIGYSAGCYGAQKFFFKYPNLFSVCIGFGGGAHNYDETKDPFILRGLKYKFDNDPNYIGENNVYRFIVQNKSVIQGEPYYIRLICGEKDPRFDNASHFRNFLLRYGYNVDLIVVEDIGHSLEDLWAMTGEETVSVAIERICDN